LLRSNSRTAAALLTPTERSAFREGARHALAIPCLVLAAGYTGFGALAAGHGLSFTGTMLSTLCIWALPGQLILVEMHTLGAPFFAVVLTVVLSGARFLPMTVVFMPLLREAGRRPLLFYAAEQFVTMTGWAWAMARFPAMPAERRLTYYFGFTLSLLFAASCATALGFLGGDLLPPTARLAIVFMSPMYFLLILAGGTTDRLGRAAVVCGAIAGPLAHLVAPQWSVLAAGFIGGSAAFALDRLLRRRNA
jgi:predicted branched-subunit amino acid permease